MTCPTDPLLLLVHRTCGLLKVHICPMLSTIQNVLFIADTPKRAQVVPVLRNIVLIIGDVKYYHVFYIM